MLHSLSWVALAAGFVFLLLSLGASVPTPPPFSVPSSTLPRHVADELFLRAASGLLYVAEVIEEHSGLAKTVGKRLVYVRAPVTNSILSHAGASSS